jgi:O-antigen ligase
MGPLEFGRINGLQQHNVYLQAFLVYGWTGAMAYLLLLGTTILVGLRAALRRTPFQPYLLTAVAALFGAMVEGLVIDTDHWRHFFLLVGIIWGASAATLKSVRPARLRPVASA